MKTSTYLIGLLFAVAALATTTPAQADATDAIIMPFTADGSSKVCQDPVDVLCDCPKGTSHCDEGDPCLVYDSIMVPPQCDVGRLTATSEQLLDAGEHGVLFWQPIDFDVGPELPVEQTGGPPIMGGYCTFEINSASNAYMCFPNDGPCKNGLNLEVRKGMTGSGVCLFANNCTVLVTAQGQYVGFRCQY